MLDFIDVAGCTLHLLLQGLLLLYALSILLLELACFGFYHFKLLCEMLTLIRHFLSHRIHLVRHLLSYRIDLVRHLLLHHIDLLIILIALSFDLFLLLLDDVCLFLTALFGPL